MSKYNQDENNTTVLTQAERHKILVEWNDTTTEYPQDKCIHQLFEEQVKQTPDAVAVVYEEESLTYQELNQKANQLAHYLVKNGVGPEVLVGICVERSLEMIVSLLGVLKAGGAYLPLDPAYPKERLAFMLQDAQVPVLLTQTKLADLLPETSEKTVCLDSDWLTIMEEHLMNVSTKVMPNNLAYVIYTSGSTGKPKGTLVTHGGMCNVIMAQRSSFNLRPSDRVLQFSTLNFDAATFEIFMALGSGASLYLIKSNELLLGSALYQFLNRHQISAVTLPPSVLATIPQDGQLPNLHTITVAGEACTADLVNRWANNRLFFNLYGPTETTIWVTVAQCYPAEEAPPIGYPIANRQLYVLDAELEPVPIGVVGELYVGGVGIARGYLTQAALTAKAFIPNLFSNTKGERLYRTGDLVRYRPDGQLEFVGRVDNQVKLRGFRIELGEIETILHNHPQITQAVVLAKKTISEDKQLVAYLTLNNQNQLRKADIYQFLSGYLPNYMIPTQFIAITSFPMTLNGKIDRRLLLKMEGETLSDESMLIAPRTVTEELLLTIWSDTLAIKNIGITDSFFELGGHSLIATQIITRIRETFNIDLPLAKLFKAPTIAELAEIIDNIYTPKTKLTASFNKPVREGKGSIPLSFPQQRVWFLNQLVQENMAYNVQLTIHFKGELNIAVLEQAFSEVVRRHEVLRTTFPAIDGEPIQVIHEPFTVKIPIIDLEVMLADKNLSEEGFQNELEQIITKEVQVAFDVTKLPLVVWKLLRLKSDEHILVQIEHHFVHDGWAISVLFREMKVLYEAFLMGKPSPLPDLSIQYADYALWQRAWLQGEVLAEKLKYWKDKLKGCQPVLDLPTDYPRPKVQRFKGAVLRLAMPPNLCEATINFSRQQGVTLFTTLFSVFSTLLYRYTQQTDIIIGSSVANRIYKEFESLIGMFVNTIVLRTQLSGDIVFTDLLNQVKQNVFEMQEHQDIPFDKLVDTLKLERDLSRNPLFQVMFSFHNAQVPILTMPNVKGEIVERSNKSAKMDLNITVIPYMQQAIGQEMDQTEINQSNKGITMLWEYNTDIFKQSSIARMTNHFYTLLENVVEAPHKRISNIPILTDLERYQLLEGWNNTHKSYDEVKCLHYLFEKQVERTPDAIAVVFEKQAVTYKTLNQKANQLAHYLQTMGVGSEVLVGICVERSIEMIVGLLGILKAGGAYVPLDPTYPSERLTFMVEDTQTSILLTQQHLFEHLNISIEQTVCLDTDWALIAKHSVENLQTKLMPQNLAYVIYTSGSTGKPKGAMNTHAGIVNRLLWSQEMYQLTPTDRILQKTPFSFDVSVWEFFWPLSVGAQLVFAKPEGHRDSKYLIELIIEQQITTLHFVPSMLQIFLETQNVEKCDSLKQVICSGEALPYSLQMRFFSKLNAKLHNLYGPTEAAVEMTYWECDHHGKYGKLKIVPIGKPITNIQTYILDKDMQPVPVQVIGELYIGGIGLARGYLGRLGLTAEKFVPNPFSKQAGKRLYKTGDLTRYLPDGSIEFLRRIDHQVKIRGFRIELGEIETVLNQHLQVRESVVLVRENETHQKQLVAYVTGKNKADLSFTKLHKHLQKQLPDYMIPSVIIFLESFPLNPNGKIDHKALPAPDEDSFEREAFVSPSTNTEKTLANIWQGVLGLERIGVHDNFFALGGHSLLATRVNSRIRTILHIDLPLKYIFEYPTIVSLAKIIEQEQKMGDDTQPKHLQSIIPQPRPEKIPLSYAQQRLWFISQLNEGNVAYNMPVALQIDGPLNIKVLSDTLTKIIARHEVLRTTFGVENGKPYQIIHPTPNFELQVINLQHLDQAEREIKTQEHLHKIIHAPFNLEIGPLLKTTLLQLNQERYILILNMHHIIGDGWSSGILIKELITLYKASVLGNKLPNGENSPLAPLPLQYADFSLWQQAYFKGETYQKQRHYWLEQLANLPPLNLPTDHPRPLENSFKGGRIKVPVAVAFLRELEAFNKQHGVTLFMTLLASFQVLLARYSGQNDIAIGVGIANRHRQELENIIGFFINTLVMRSNLDGNPSFEQLLQQVKQTALAGMQNQDVPFEHLVDALKVERQTGINPLFQVMLVLQNYPVEELTVLDLKLSPADIPYDIAKFDLTLNVYQSENELMLHFEYNGDLFEKETIERLATHYKTLLTAIVKQPYQPIANLPLLTDAEYQQIVVDWNKTQTEYPQDKCIHYLFEEQVERTPNAVAVVFEDKHLTYQQLNQKANQLAHYLINQGVGPETLVGLCVERSLEMIIGLLGILKAGGAYVPLDPNYPHQRLTFMLQDAQLSLLLTQSSLQEQFKQFNKSITYLDKHWSQIAQQPSTNSSILISPHNLAYVIYTSGSTGKPKGVQISHKSVMNLITWHRNRFSISSQDKATQVASLAFDAAVWEIWPYLASGANIYIANDQQRSDPMVLQQWLLTNKITVSFVPTSLVEEMLTLSWPMEISLRLLLTGGDKLNRYPNKIPFKLINNYGPTENTVVSTSGTVEMQTDFQSAPAIGYPINNTKLYILDKDLNPVPVGIPGELHIAGVGLSWGYLNHVALTAEKFIPNPFNQELEARNQLGSEGIKDKQTNILHPNFQSSNTRLYKTGDLARYLPDGNIEFLGRVDHQVKIRGFRIELGEIEVVLGQHPQIKEVIAIIRENETQQKQLVAYIIAKNGADINATELRQHLQKQLPDYMIPTTFVLLERFPLTPNGKIDRLALQEVDGTFLLTSHEFVAPQTSTEQILANIWAKILDLDKVGRDDNFFEAGGHSLTALQMISQINQQFLIDLSVQDIFKYQRLADLAKFIATFQQTLNSLKNTNPLSTERETFLL